MLQAGMRQRLVAMAATAPMAGLAGRAARAGTPVQVSTDPAAMAARAGTLGLRATGAMGGPAIAPTQTALQAATAAILAVQERGVRPA